MNSPKLPIHRKSIIGITIIVVGVLLIWVMICGNCKILRVKKEQYKLSESRPVVEENSVQPVLDLVADWQTYHDEEYGYEIKYPDSWLTQIDSIGTVKPYRYRVFMPGRRDTSRKTISVEVHIINKEPKGLPEIGSAKFYKSDDCFEGERNITYLAPHPNNAFYIQIVLSTLSGRFSSCLSNEEISSELDMFDQMLSTFRFIK